MNSKGTVDASECSPHRSPGETCLPSKVKFRFQSATFLGVSSKELLIVYEKEGGKPLAFYSKNGMAFDCLDHKYPKQKLTNLGIRGRTQAWFSSYLANRNEKVEIVHL